MAAEYRPDLKEAVDILINGPVEARIPSTEPGVSDWARRLRNWAATPFSRWLTGHPTPSETPAIEMPVRSSPITGLRAAKRVELRQEAYEIFDQLLSHAEIAFPEDPSLYSDFHLPSPDHDQVNVLSVRRGTQQGKIVSYIDVNFYRYGSNRTDRALMVLDRNDAPEIDRESYTPKGQNTPSLRPYSPTEDAIALIVLGKAALNQQRAQIIDDDREHSLPH